MECRSAPILVIARSDNAVEHRFEDRCSTQRANSLYQANILKRITTAFAISAALLVQIAVPVIASDTPFGYPSTLLRARSTYTVSPATPVMLGDTVVVLEQSRLSDVAAIVGSRVHTDEDGRRWVCAQTKNADSPLRLWFIATGQETITEVQMSPGTFTGSQSCGRLTAHFEPVYLSRIQSGMTIREITADIGPASAHDAQGWHFWVSRRNYSYDGANYTEYVWVGAHEVEGKVREVFTTQLTR